MIILKQTFQHRDSATMNRIGRHKHTCKIYTSMKLSEYENSVHFNRCSTKEDHSHADLGHLETATWIYERRERERKSHSSYIYTSTKLSEKKDSLAS